MQNNYSFLRLSKEAKEQYELSFNPIYGQLGISLEPDNSVKASPDTVPQDGSYVDGPARRKRVGSVHLYEDVKFMGKDEISL